SLPELRHDQLSQAFTTQWAFYGLVGMYRAAVQHALSPTSTQAQLEYLATRLRLLEASVARSKRTAATVAIQTFAPEPYALAEPISVLVEKGEDGGYVATFFDANIASAGDTSTEAVDNLKSLTLDIYDDLVNEDEASLSSPARTQLAVLRYFIS